MHIFLHFAIFGTSVGQADGVAQESLAAHEHLNLQRGRDCVQTTHEQQLRANGDSGADGEWDMVWGHS